jgi:hypothetical protein
MTPGETRLALDAGVGYFIRAPWPVNRLGRGLIVAA